MALWKTLWHICSPSPTVCKESSFSWCTAYSTKRCCIVVFLNLFLPVVPYLGRIIDEKDFHFPSFYISQHMLWPPVMCSSLLCTLKYPYGPWLRITDVENKRGLSRNVSYTNNLIFQIFQTGFRILWAPGTRIVRAMSHSQFLVHARDKECGSNKCYFKFILQMNWTGINPSHCSQQQWCGMEWHICFPCGTKSHICNAYREMCSFFTERFWNIAKRWGVVGFWDAVW